MKNDGESMMITVDYYGKSVTVTINKDGFITSDDYVRNMIDIGEFIGFMRESLEDSMKEQLED